MFDPTVHDSDVPATTADTSGFYRLLGDTLLHRPNSAYGPGFTLLAEHAAD